MRPEISSKTFLSDYNLELLEAQFNYCPNCAGQGRLMTAIAQIDGWGKPLPSKVSYDRCNTCGGTGKKVTGRGI